MMIHSSFLSVASFVALVGAGGVSPKPSCVLAPCSRVTPGTQLDSAGVAAALAATHALVEAGRFRDAMRSYHSLADTQRAAGDYPIEALRHLAELQYVAGQESSAASTLDELANEAKEFGDPETQLRALFDAAVMYQQLRMNDRVGDSVRQINRLLKSPAIDESVRREISARLVQH